MELEEMSLIDLVEMKKHLQGCLWKEEGPERKMPAELKKYLHDILTKIYYIIG